MPIALLIVMAVLAVGIVGMTVLGAGLLPGSVATFFAFLPVLPVIGVLLWIDRWEPEPGKLLLGAFLWGSSIAVITAVIGSVLLDHAWTATLGATTGDALSLVATAPVIEELFKGLFVLLVFWRRRGEFDGVVDGIVYAGLVGAGFAFTENVGYLSSAFSEDGLTGGLVLFFWRCVLGPFAHPIFTAMLGIGLGIASTTSSRSLRYVAPVLGYLAGVLVHGLWNGSTLWLDGGGFFVVYVLVMVPVFVALLLVVIWQRKREQRIVATQLAGMVANGWVQPDEVRPLASLGGRQRWRNAVKQRSGPDAAKAIRDYHTAVTELAFLRDRMVRGVAGPDAERCQHELVVALAQARARAIGHPQALATAWQAAAPYAQPYPPPHSQPY